MKRWLKPKRKAKCPRPQTGGFCFARRFVVARKKAPAAERLSATRARRLGAGSALAQLQLELTPQTAYSAFSEWRMNPVTMMMIESLRELGVSPPAAYIDTDSIPVQYGVSSGLSLAAAFMSDPRTLYQHLFSGAAPGNPQPVPDADYLTDPMSIIGSARTPKGEETSK